MAPVGLPGRSLRHEVDGEGSDARRADDGPDPTTAVTGVAFDSVVRQQLVEGLSSCGLHLSFKRSSRLESPSP